MGKVEKTKTVSTHQKINVELQRAHNEENALIGEGYNIGLCSK